jgi:hypothetical protein
LVKDTSLVRNSLVVADPLVDIVFVLSDQRTAVGSRRGVHEIRGFFLGSSDVRGATGLTLPGPDRSAGLSYATGSAAGNGRSSRIGCAR